VAIAAAYTLIRAAVSSTASADQQRSLGTPPGGPYPGRVLINRDCPAIAGCRKRRRADCAGGSLRHTTTRRGALGASCIQQRPAPHVSGQIGLRAANHGVACRSRHVLSLVNHEAVSDQRCPSARTNSTTTKLTLHPLVVAQTVVVLRARLRRAMLARNPRARLSAGSRDTCCNPRGKSSGARLRFLAPRQESPRLRLASADLRCRLLRPSVRVQEKRGPPEGLVRGASHTRAAASKVIVSSFLDFRNAAPES